jgi:hypothetical protein
MRSRALPSFAFTLSFLFALGCGRTDPTPQASAATPPAVSLAPELMMPVKGGSPGSLGALGPAPRMLEKFDAAEVNVPAGKSTLHIAWDLPPGTGINDEAPFAVRWSQSDGLVAPPSDIVGVGKEVAAGFDVPLEPMATATAAQLAGEVSLVVCDVATHSVCVPLKRRLEVTFGITKGGKPGSLRVPLPQAKR